MKIACLGWGSLVWDPRGLPLRKPWFMDGPLLPIEFARQSKGDRITLVIVNNAAQLRSLWALMSVTEFETAKKGLAVREGIIEKNISKYIGYWSSNEYSSLDFTQEIGDWAARKDHDAVVWTALPPKFGGQNERMPSAEEVITFLRNLPYEKRKHAEEYIRRTPQQIDTDYRRKIEEKFNWSPLADF